MKAPGAGGGTSGPRPGGVVGLIGYSAATCMGLVMDGVKVYIVGKRPEQVSIPGSSQYPEYLEITTVFDQSQIEAGEIGACAVLFLADLFSQNVVGWRWYGPDGNLVGANDYTIPSNPSGWLWYYVWSGLINSVHITANGAYHVDILWNGLLLCQLYFTVTGLVGQPETSEFAIVDYSKV